MENPTLAAPGGVKTGFAVNLRLVRGFDDHQQSGRF